MTWRRLIATIGEEGFKFIDELATHAAEGRHGGLMAQKEVFKERRLQVISVATQVAISRKVQRYKLELGGRQEADGMSSSFSSGFAA